MKIPANLVPNILSVLGLAGLAVCVAALAGAWWGGLAASVELVAVGYMTAEQ